jgi:hypothetical protein
MGNPTTIIPDPTEAQHETPPHPQPIADADGSPVAVDPTVRKIERGLRDWEKDAEDARLHNPAGQDDD